MSGDAHQPLPPAYLSSYEARAHTAELIDAGSGGHIADGMAVAELIDAVTACICIVVGLGPDNARTALAILWAE